MLKLMLMLMSSTALLTTPVAAQANVETLETKVQTRSNDGMTSAGLVVVPAEIDLGQVPEGETVDGSRVARQHLMATHDGG